MYSNFIQTVKLADYIRERQRCNVRKLSQSKVDSRDISSEMQVKVKSKSKV